jgi:hypothetical protein
VKRVAYWIAVNVAAVLSAIGILVSAFTRLISDIDSVPTSRPNPDVNVWNC